MAAGRGAAGSGRGGVAALRQQCRGAQGPVLRRGLTFGSTEPPEAGCLDAVQVLGLGRVGVLGTMWQVLRGNGTRHPAIRRRQVRTLRIEAETPLPLEVDGEIVGQTPATFSVHPSRLTTVV
ncbi:diacylglycerol/lipid kinase family protein [Plantactinospora veratri]